jgi:nucleoside-diphosphate-sugar epimerase
LQQYDAVIFGYGAITHRLIEKIAPEMERILCVTNSARSNSFSMPRNIEIISPTEVSKTCVSAKYAIFSWRSVPNESLILDWLISRMCEIQSIIHLSSASVYSDHLSVIKEIGTLDNSFNLNSPKLKLEWKLSEISELKGTSFSNLRISNAYGVGLEVGFISHLIQAIQNSGPITISSSPHIKRDYIHIADIVEGIYRILKTEDSFPVVHISTGVGTSLSQLLRIFEGLGYIFQDRNFLQDKISPSCVLEPKILLEISDWRPRSLSEGLKSTLRDI